MCNLRLLLGTDLLLGKDPLALRDHHQTTFLKQHKYISNDGLYLYADNKYAKRIGDLVGLDKQAKPTVVPISQARKPEDEKFPLEEELKPKFVPAVCMLRYLRQQKADIGYAAKELSQCMVNPNQEDMKRLKQTARYLHRLGICITDRQVYFSLLERKSRC